MKDFSLSSKQIIEEILESYQIRDCYIRNVQECIDMNIIRHFQWDIFLPLKPLIDKYIFYN
jgi:hypothetical protein